MIKTVTSLIPLNLRGITQENPLLNLRGYNLTDNHD